MKLITTLLTAICVVLSISLSAQTVTFEKLPNSRVLIDIDGHCTAVNPADISVAQYSTDQIAISNTRPQGIDSRFPAGSKFTIAMIDWANCVPAQATPADTKEAVKILGESFFDTGLGLGGTSPADVASALIDSAADIRSAIIDTAAQIREDIVDSNGKDNTFFIFGLTNADDLLLDFEPGEALHWQTVNIGAPQFFTAGDLTTAIDGDLLNNPTPNSTIALPTAQRGILYKTSTGIAVEYTTQVQAAATPQDSTWQIGDKTFHKRYDGSVDTTANLTSICALNEYIHNIKDYKLAFAYENGGKTISAKVNGVDATFENLNNAVDNGDGSVTLSGGGGNQVFDKLASTVGTIRDVGDSLNVSFSGNIGGFSQLYVSVTDLDSINASQAANTIRLRLAGGTHEVRDESNTVVYTNTGGSQGTYTFLRTYYGFDIKRNGQLLYSSPDTCINYNDVGQPTIVTSSSGFHRIGLHAPVTPINTTSNTSSLTTIPTGFDFTQASGMTWRLYFSDQSTSIAWQIVEIDVDQMIASYNTNASLDTYAQIYDNDWMRIEVIDPATGDIGMRDQGRDMKYVKSELWITTSGNILIAPDGGCWEQSVDNSGNIITTSISCN